MEGTEVLALPQFSYTAVKLKEDPRNFESSQAMQHLSEDFDYVSFECSLQDSFYSKCPSKIFNEKIL